MTSSFVLFCSFNKLLIKTNSSRLQTESIKALKIKTSIMFNLDFANNIILLSFFFFIIDLHFLISAVIAQIFNPIAELIIPIGIPTKEAKSEMEIHPGLVKSKIKKVLNII